MYLFSGAFSGAFIGSVTSVGSAVGVGLAASVGSAANDGLTVKDGSTTNNFLEREFVLKVLCNSVGDVGDLRGEFMNTVS